jgi:HAD superfamily hydrolase (TIGR01509 family)
LNKVAKLDAVLFDVDGTLVDSNDLHAESWAKTFAHFGFDVPVDAIRGQIGKGGDNLIPALIEGLSDQRQEEMDSWRGDLFKRDYLDRVRPFPGVCALFERIRDRGLTIVLASSATTDDLDHHLKMLGCGDLVAGQTTSDDVENSKPDPDIFAAALKKAGADASAAIAIGDTPYDILAAGKIGLRTIGFRCGGFDEGALREAGAIALFDGPEDLLARFDESPLA